MKKRTITRFRLYLEKEGISVSEMTEKLGVARNTIQLILNGHPPLPRNATKIVNFTKGEIDYNELYNPTWIEVDD